jgi:hypothetical protein
MKTQPARPFGEGIAYQMQKVAYLMKQPYEVHKNNVSEKLK